jgi:hypothetical protein
MNPFGMIVFCIMVVSPLWIGYDLISKKEINLIEVLFGNY